jgi:hypothetical protein
MTDQERDLMAAEYVLGTLDGPARYDFAEALARDSGLQRLVADWEGRLAGLDDPVSEEAPSVDLWGRLHATLDAETGAAGPAITIRSSGGDWHEVMEGVEKKSLIRDEELGEESYLLRVAPGTVFPSHGHEKIEECLVIEGEFFIGELRLSAGDFHAVPAGFDHVEAYTEIGTTVFIRGEIRDAA